MPNRTKKGHKCNHHTGGSRWHNFHFSGKLIVCSVIFGLMLILIGGIVMAIGMDRDEDTKSDDYDDLQKKPPMTIVGPVIMGIGGFTVFVGVFMCLVETNVCRKRNVENNPLIEGESQPIDSEATGIDSDPTAIPSTSHKHRKADRKKSPSPRAKLSSKRQHSTKDRNHEATSPRSPSSAPIDVGGNSSKDFLSASDKFVTPPSVSSLALQSNSRDAENQTSSSLMTCFTSSGNSWTLSTEYQTPNASSIENSMAFESSQLKEGMHDMLDLKSSIISSHEFLTPKPSSAEMVNSFELPADTHIKEKSEITISGSTSELNQSVSNGILEIHHQEIKQQKVGLCGAPKMASAESVVVETQLENRYSQYIPSDLSLKKTESLYLSNESEGENTPQTEAVESTLKSSKNAENKEIDTKQYERVPFDTPLNLGTETDLKDNDLVNKDIDKMSDHIKIPNQVVIGEIRDINEVVLRESNNPMLSSEGLDLSASQGNDSQSTCQECGDNSQEVSSESVELLQNITESESINETSDSTRKCSFNNNET